MNKIAEGRTAEVYEYDNDTLLKMFRGGIALTDADLEYAIAKYAHSQGIKTPEPIRIEEQDGRRGIVFERIHGQTLLAAMLRRPWRIRYYSKSMADLHLELHARDAIGTLRDHKAVLAQYIRSAPMLEDGEKERIIDHLSKLPSDNKLIHGDFHPENILDESGTAWIIDWITAMNGSPAADAARTWLLISYGTLPASMPRIVKRIVNALRRQIRATYINRYLQQSGLSFADIEQWLVPIAAARLVEWLPDEEKEALVQMIRQKLSKLFVNCELEQGS